jgi:hypothetical protein
LREIDNANAFKAIQLYTIHRSHSSRETGRHYSAGCLSRETGGSGVRLR